MPRRKDVVLEAGVGADNIQQSSVDDALYHRLLEIIPSFPSQELPMDIGQFFQSHVSQGGTLDCRKSRYGSVSKWMKAMEHQGLVLMKKVGKKGPARVVAVGPSQVALFRSHKKPEVGLTAANLAKLSVTEEAEADSLGSINSGELDDEDHDLEEDAKSIAISEAMSMATTTYSIATADYNIQPTIHAKQRQQQRGIHRREIQSAVKAHGAVTSRARDGRKLFQGDNGVAVVVSGGEKNTIITTWRQDEDGDPLESWREETVFETKAMLSSRVIRMTTLKVPHMELGD